MAKKKGGAVTLKKGLSRKNPSDKAKGPTMPKKGMGGGKGRTA